jgi:hypothetical protein
MQCLPDVPAHEQDPFTATGRRGVPKLFWKSAAGPCHDSFGVLETFLPFPNHLPAVIIKPWTLSNIRTGRGGAGRWLQNQEKVHSDMARLAANQRHCIRRAMPELVEDAYCNSETCRNGLSALGADHSQHTKDRISWPQHASPAVGRPGNAWNRCSR